MFLSDWLNGRIALESERHLGTFGVFTVKNGKIPDFVRSKKQAVLFGLWSFCRKASAFLTL